MLKIGLMGCGVVAGYGHLPAIAGTAGLKLASVFDPDAGRAQAAAAKYGAAAYTEAEAFFGSDIDVVTITSPAPCHRENVLMAARYGKPVLCEKPIAMNEAQTCEMIAAMERAGLPFYVGFTYRFSPAALRIRQLVRAGAIGKVQSLRLIYIWNLHGKYEKNDIASGKLNERRIGRMLEGGPMVDCGVHQIDLARWWLGSEAVQVQAHGAWVDEYEAPDHMYLHLDHANGAHTMVEISYSYDYMAKTPRAHFVYELIGDRGVIRYNREQHRFDLSTPAGIEELPFAEEKGFSAMYEELVNAMRTGRSEIMPTAQDGVAATRIATAATQQAIAQRRRVFAQGMRP